MTGSPILLKDVAPVRKEFFYLFEGFLQQCPVLLRIERSLEEVELSLTAGRDPFCPPQMREASG